MNSKLQNSLGAVISTQILTSSKITWCEEKQENALTKCIKNILCFTSLNVIANS